MTSGNKRGDKGVGHSFEGSRENVADKAVRLIEEELGCPIPEYVKYSAEALADVMILHGEDEMKSLADTMRKEIEYHRLVHDEGIDAEEASTMVFGPPPSV